MFLGCPNANAFVLECVCVTHQQQNSEIHPYTYVYTYYTYYIHTVSAYIIKIQKVRFWRVVSYQVPPLGPSPLVARLNSSDASSLGCRVQHGEETLASAGGVESNATLHYLPFFFERH